MLRTTITLTDYIVDLEALHSGIRRLLLDSKDTCLVSCALASRGCAKQIDDDTHPEKAMPHITTSGPWYRDLWAILSRINHHHDLGDRIWSIYFEKHATPIGSCDIINNHPFAMRAWHRIWEVGWRRDGLYAAVLVNVPDLIDTIRGYAS